MAMKTATANYFQQLDAAEKLIASYHAYAKQIGCVIVEPDMIECTNAQAELLARKWGELFKGMGI